jgi:aldehyde:ferredoxin oxidoreductase
MDLDEAALKKIVNRSRNLHRAYNNRLGMTRADEKPPEDHWKRRYPDIEENLLSTYYKFKGWNMNGVPTKEKLKELDLGYVAEDLEKRGILKDGQD